MSRMEIRMGHPGRFPAAARLLLPVMALLVSLFAQGCASHEEKYLGKLESEWTKELGSDSWQTRKEAVKALREFNTDGAIDAVKAATADDDSNVREEAFASLWVVGAKAWTAVPCCIRAIRKDPSTDVRVWAIKALPDICICVEDLHEYEVLECIKAARESRNPEIRKEASCALEKMKKMAFMPFWLVKFLEMLW